PWRQHPARAAPGGAAEHPQRPDARREGSHDPGRRIRPARYLLFGLRLGNLRDPARERPPPVSEGYLARAAAVLRAREHRRRQGAAGLQAATGAQGAVGDRIAGRAGRPGPVRLRSRDRRERLRLRASLRALAAAHPGNPVGPARGRVSRPPRGGDHRSLALSRSGLFRLPPAGRARRLFRQPRGTVAMSPTIVEITGGPADRALLADFYESIYAASFTDPNERESLMRLRRFLRLKARGWYGR